MSTTFKRVSAREFNDAIIQTKSISSTFDNNLSLYSLSEYEKMKCYMSIDGETGFAIKQASELVNVFSLIKGRGDEILSLAVKLGANRLDCFDNGKLPTLYAKYGFKITKRESNFTYGEPDVLFMSIQESLT